MTIMWGGFTNGNLDTRETDVGFGGWGDSRHWAPAIFAEESDARQQYRDVRPVEITEITLDQKARRRGRGTDLSEKNQALYEEITSARKIVRDAYFRAREREDKDAVSEFVRALNRSPPLSLSDQIVATAEKY